MAVELANVGSYGALWLLQFFLCDRILFCQRKKVPFDELEETSVAA
jgi:hypothetical protein